jgi:hypothetical protein
VDSELVQFRTEKDLAVPAEIASAAALVDIGNDTIAGRQPFRIPSELFDHTREFMSGHEWQLVSGVLPGVDAMIGSADSCVLDFYQDIVIANRGYRNLPDGDDAGFLEYGSFHHGHHESPFPGKDLILSFP